MSKLPIHVYDPGHGGADPGAVARGFGLREKDLNLFIARRARETAMANYEVDVRLTRDSDTTMDLKARTDFANKLSAALLVSFHVNAGGGTGYEDFIHINLLDSSLTARLRQAYHLEVSKFLAQRKIRNRGMKKQNFHMLRESKMPAILNETLFIDHAEDQKQLAQESFLIAIADCYAHALCKAAGLKPRVKAKPEPAPAPKLTGQVALHRVIVDGAQIGAWSNMSFLLRNVEKALESGAKEVKIEPVK